MDNLSKLIAANRRMDAWGQMLVLNMAEAQARKHPVESQPRLQAVANKGLSRWLVPPLAWWLREVRDAEMASAIPQSIRVSLQCCTS